MNTQNTEMVVRQMLKEEPTLITYVRGRKRQPVGVIVARNYNGYLHLGYSLCNTKKDPFNRWWGIWKAVKRITTYTSTYGEEIPYTVAREVDNMIDRAERYFKTKFTF